ncbi:MAG: PAS domain S-box protein [Candidatus Nanopelagicales bacterium]|nr:PAS domain S-box protein [Candidatus Nanopelagicales bacterium]MCF8539346.1 PAS domain S-box protein [Candidatus Nanopelagicales bacterium]MCF8551505.1 PAS domain S-box protein [Candidatus Nanopelagicales bacterium]
MTQPEAGAEFQALLSHPNAVVWTMSVGGEVTFISPSIERVRGITPEEAMVQTPDQIHPPESLKKSLTYFESFSKSLIAGEVPEDFHAHLDYFHRNGSVIPFEVMAVPSVGEDGIVTELRGVSVPREDL